MPSPRRLKASTVTVIASPGKKASHHGGHERGDGVRQHIAPGRRRRRHPHAEEAERGLDDDGHAEVGGGKHEIRGDALGQDVNGHDAQGEAPLHRPASTKGISRTESATERMTRPPKGMRVMAMAKITAWSPVPMAMEMAMARMRSGKAWSISMTRWLTRSKRPGDSRRTPHSEPTVVPRRTAENATNSEVRAP